MNLLSYLLITTFCLIKILFCAPTNEIDRSDIQNDFDLNANLSETNFPPWVLSLVKNRRTFKFIEYFFYSSKLIDV